VRFRQTSAHAPVNAVECGRTDGGVWTECGRTDGRGCRSSRRRRETNQIILRWRRGRSATFSHLLLLPPHDGSTGRIANDDEPAAFNHLHQVCVFLFAVKQSAAGSGVHPRDDDGWETMAGFLGVIVRRQFLQLCLAMRIEGAGNDVRCMDCLQTVHGRFSQQRCNSAKIHAVCLRPPLGGDSKFVYSVRHAIKKSG
jgi:hypothetical protein